MRRLSRNLSTRAPAPKRRRTTARKSLGLLAVGAMAIPGAVFLLPQAGQAALPAECTLDTPTGSAVTCVYDADNTFEVPDGVTSVTVSAQGGAGGDAPGATGGRGAIATAVLTTAPGDTLILDVAGDLPDIAAGGTGDNAGGAGGGASVVSDLNGPTALLAGGGGGGAGDPNANGGNGGVVAGEAAVANGADGSNGAQGGNVGGGAGNNPGENADMANSGGGGGGKIDATNTRGGGDNGAVAGGSGAGGASFGPLSTTYALAPAGEPGKITLKYNACRSAKGVSLSDAMVTEGNAGTVDLEFAVSLASASNCGDSTVTVQTDPSPIPPSATATEDYVSIDAPGMAVTFLANETSKVVNVTINGDTTAEPDEFLLLSVVSATSATVSDVDDKVTITRGVAAGKIVNDDAAVVASPTIVGTASANVALGGTVTDSATVTGRVDALVEAGITFRLYGPNDPGCVGTPVFTQSVAQPVADGPVSSGTFTPTVPGDYLWRAFYSGDANNNPVATACGAPGQSVSVTGFAALSSFSCGGSPATHVIRANAANRTLSTGGGRQVIVVEAGGGGATINSGSGNDAICGGPGNDNINSGSGNDFIRGNGGDDTINAGSGVNDVG